jgi:hypothetical protein
MSIREQEGLPVSRTTLVEKLRMRVDIVAVRTCYAQRLLLLPVSYAAPNRTDTSFDTPGSCMVTP